MRVRRLSPRADTRCAPANDTGRAAELRILAARHPLGNAGQDKDAPEYVVDERLRFTLCGCGWSL